MPELRAKQLCVCRCVFVCVCDGTWRSRTPASTPAYILHASPTNKQRLHCGQPHRLAFVHGMLSHAQVDWLTEKMREANFTCSAMCVLLGWGVAVHVPLVSSFLHARRRSR
jgi:hypothetical protein